MLAGTTAWLVGQTSEEGLRLILELALGVSIVALLGIARGRGRHAAAILVISATVVTGTGCWIGANSAQLRWFGDQISHGSRSTSNVALTFDDGPNDSDTLALAEILDEADAKGTFFSVGKAVNRRPAISRELVADGHLIGNHSYHHDSTHWLDPRYPELGKAERAIANQTGVCPAFFRAPHGQHTPFVAMTVHRAHMVMIGWDVSASDWKSHDPVALAHRILSRVRPGSIVDLHDGLDGDVLADRRVLIRALPLILRGLEKRGLQAVRLDVLLGRPGYRAGCDLPRRVHTRAAARGIAMKSIAASIKVVRERKMGTATSSSFRTL
ncbi:MAG: peptidoglycan-N-acetylglucosamine deacetylase [Microbacteriaceae bacterium]|nr:peptidoglycan-N-acetylglucosamine deacetylase [Microbacteriaceae bacterium]